MTRTGVLAGLTVLCGLWIGWPVREGQVDRAALGLVLVYAGCLVLLANRRPTGWWSAPVVYLAVFGLFHAGLLVSVALRGDSGLLLPSSAGWLYGPYTPGAVRLVLLGTLGYTAAAHAVWLRAGRTAPPPATARPGQSTVDVRAGAVGIAAQLAGLALAARPLRAPGYTAYLDAARGSTAVSYAMLLIGLGTVFAVGGTRRQRGAGLALFAAFALVAFPLGLRGEVLFPLAVLLVVEARRGRRVRAAVALPAGLVVLALIGLVRQTRVGGPADWASPLDAVAEMGYSLYPAVLVEEWRAGGEPLARGATFVAVPLRLAERATGRHGGPPAPDYRLFNVEVADRAGPVGGSPVAEAYHNLGRPGVVLLLAAIGYAIARLDARPGDALLAVVLLPLTLEIRQAFAPLPVQLLVGAALLALARTTPRLRPHGDPRRETRGKRGVSRRGSPPGTWISAWITTTTTSGVRP